MVPRKTDIPLRRLEPDEKPPCSVSLSLYAGGGDAARMTAERESISSSTLMSMSGTVVTH